MEKILKSATLCFLRRENDVLLARKTRFIGAGLFNGYGGGIEEEDESPEAAALRELEKESGIQGVMDSLAKIAIVDFHNQLTSGDHSYVMFMCMRFDIGME